MLTLLERPPIKAVAEDPLVMLDRYLGPNYQEKVGRLLLKAGKYTPDTMPQFREAPQRHVYKDGRKSAAINLSEVEIGEDVHIVSFLPPNALSSEHYHDGFVEEYTLLEGEATLGGEPLPLGEVIPVKPETLHQVRTTNSHVLLHIIMKGAALLPPEERHLNTKNLYSAEEALGRALNEGFPVANLEAV